MNTSFMTRCRVSVVTAFVAVTLAACSSSHRDAAPSISTVSDQTIDMDGSTTALAFTVNDQETPADQLQVSVNSSNPALAPASGITVAGTGRNRSVQIAAVPDQFGSATITLVVRDYRGNTASSRFMLTVRDTRQAFAGYSKTLLANVADGDAVDISSAKFIFDNNSDEGAYDDVLASAP